MLAYIQRSTCNEYSLKILIETGGVYSEVVFSTGLTAYRKRENSLIKDTFKILKMLLFCCITSFSWLVSMNFSLRYCDWIFFHQLFELCYHLHVICNITLVLVNISMTSCASRQTFCLLYE